MGPKKPPVEHLNEPPMAKVLHILPLSPQLLIEEFKSHPPSYGSASPADALPGFVTAAGWRALLPRAHRYVLAALMSLG